MHGHDSCLLTDLGDFDPDLDSQVTSQEASFAGGRHPQYCYPPILISKIGRFYRHCSVFVVRGYFRSVLAVTQLLISAL
ncbi:hypothetical protein PAXRUDRAFT_320194 [Paxillus rubicundulus Ve08.2h10]|uniref:Uncharacterized protein n=1 Tax=Paxillus rubicundulus Ve08.2h10 TaxID=930991 RepID=A0A0D0DF63_9AGAM|nr:hypothetical protein PAXRUDRAFT_320194 [Paxillus rubicundulus Ve08.2h10]